MDWNGDPQAQEVHYLTRRVTIACQPQRKDLDGAPLNTTDRAQVTCPACVAVLAGVT